MVSDNKNILTVKDLKKHYPVKSNFLNKDKKVVKAVDGINLAIKKGETLGLVGESGCGKSTFGRTILRLIESTSGSVLYNGNNILSYNNKEVRSLRSEMQIIFQDAGASLNPRMTLGEIIRTPLEIFRLAKGTEVEERVIELLNLVGLNESYIHRFPHELSGGQKQRVGIARALAVNPKFLVCDEPVSALDVSVQSQILNLMKKLKETLNLTYLFISHDLSVVNHICDRVAVMYLGKIVEIAHRDKLFNNPSHPYTKALLSAIPIPDPTINRERIVLEGDVPNPTDPPKGCRFYNRCQYRMEKCASIYPSIDKIDDNHFVACHLYHKNG
ncbi:ABC transporter ATP-binding protein [Lentibacillus populi]|uniref:ABC transporter ATP-binding protein n=1 Tax=Lentibacillus populi TaxID=1827502 RepID=A0A9W5TWY5_9BACI|nr:oligopeptide/dipeptide ABC transporter ATP-binding protein [Lentibacillus populi]GGB39205.1 ABC transporter ATP-binding protein [Lentibacillus populi]